MVHNKNVTGKNGTGKNGTSKKKLVKMAHCSKIIFKNLLKNFSNYFLNFSNSLKSTCAFLQFSIVTYLHQNGISYYYIQIPHRYTYLITSTAFFNL